jgi:hypothetical protein
MVTTTLLKNRKGPVMMERFYEATRLSTDWKGLLWTVAGACWDESWEALPTPPPFPYTTACLDQFIQRFVIPSSVYTHYIIQHLFILNLRLFPSQTKLPLHPPAHKPFFSFEVLIVVVFFTLVTKICFPFWSLQIVLSRFYILGFVSLRMLSWMIYEKNYVDITL